MRRSSGRVYLVGAGPGDPELITVRGLRLLRRADVVLYDRLAPPQLLAKVKSGAIVEPVGKQSGGGVSQERINELLVEHARAGRMVVRLKGGDPFVFGRGFEELAACRNAGVDCEVVPGVSSAIAGPASAGLPVTNRAEAQSVAIVTAAGAAGEHVEHDYSALARMDTVVVMMGREALRQFCVSLQSGGRNGNTPAVCVEQATTAAQRVVSGTLATIADEVERAELAAPVVTLIGTTARHATGVNGQSLAGVRVWLTRPRSTAGEMRRLLAAAGATVIEEPLIRIVYPGGGGLLDEALKRVADYDWVVFTSVHGVQAFKRGMQRLGLGRNLQARIAAVGPATAAAVERMRLAVDLIPAIHTGASLAEVLIEVGPKPWRALYPRSDIASGILVDRLRGAGVMVDDVAAYHTVEVETSDERLATLVGSVDAVVLCSPSAARAYASVLPSRERIPALVGAREDSRTCESRTSVAICCIGPVTANAAKNSGLEVNVIADRHTTEGVVEALNRYFLLADHRDPGACGPEQLNCRAGEQEIMLHPLS